jgi:hypothetical protein
MICSPALNSGVLLHGVQGLQANRASANLKQNYKRALLTEIVPHQISLPSMSRLLERAEGITSAVL